jgi:predicted transcriptional regulator
MGVITISLDNEIEKKLRKLAIARFKKRKGYLAMAITEALQDWASKSNEKEMDEALELLENGINLGGIISKKREDLHKR